MSLLEDLKGTRLQYKGELELILEFVNTTEKSLTRKQKRKPKVQLEKNDKDDLKKLVEFLDESISSESKGKKSLSLKSEAVGKLINNFLVPMKHKSFLTEMTLSYLISYQEAMLKDYLFNILTNRKSSLKSKNKISYDEVLSFTSIKSLIVSLAQKEVDQLGYGSIDDVEKYFFERFNIKLSDFESWEDIVEASYRRNLVIHNKGRTNDLYCKRTGFQKRNVSIGVDIDYVSKVSENLIEFNEYCFKSFKAKFKLA
jgi:hypothetical protein